MVKALLAAVAVALCATAATAGSPTFRFFGSAGDEGQWRTPRDTSPLNPANFLGLKRFTNTTDLTVFADLAFPDRANKLHAKVRASSVSPNTSEDTSTTKLTVGELYWQHSFGPSVDLTVGRRIEKWGTGYAWNPTGFVNPRKDPSDPNDRLSSYRGLDMLELGLFIREWSIAVLALPNVDWNSPHAAADRTAWAVRAYRLIHGTDVSLVARGGSDVRSEGINLARVFGNALELHAEAAWNQNDTRNTAFATRHTGDVQYLFGGQYTFPHDVNLVLEYYHNGNGYTPAEWRDFRSATNGASALLFAFNDPLPLLALNRTYSQSALGREYAFQRLYAPAANDRLQLEAISIENLRDTSGLARLTATWKLRSNLQLYASQTELWGGRASEFHYLQVQRLSYGGVRWYF